MSPRRKKGDPMKYRGFYCPDDLWKDMQFAAEKLDESDSEYIRKAMEERNARYALKTALSQTHPANPESYVANPITPEPKEKARETEQPKMVQSFMKGSK